MPQPPSSPSESLPSSPSSPSSPHPPPETFSCGREYIEQRLRADITVEPFVSEIPDNTLSGKPIPDVHGLNAHDAYQQELGDNPDDFFGPWSSELESDFVKWAKEYGISGGAIDAFLTIRSMVDTLGFQFRTNRAMNKIVDTLPNGRPSFTRQEIKLNGLNINVYFRNIIECIRALFGNPDFAQYLVFLPEKHYLEGTDGKRIRIYHDMHTGNWWFTVQHDIEKVNPNATVIPVIISTDETRVTMFGNKSVYPVYLTIGNLPKDIRRKPSRQGYILLGYIPNVFLDHLSTKAARRRATLNLTHAALGLMTEPLIDAGKFGVPMATGNGDVYHVHPILAAHIADYPEQCTVTCVKKNHCPQCWVDPDDLSLPPAKHPYRDMQQVLLALDQLDLTQPLKPYTDACAAAGIKPVVHPYWEKLPYCDIFRSITPDVLHQLLQGLIKSLLSWIKAIFPAADIDARCKHLPRNHNVRHFFKGITHLSQLTGESQLY